MPPFFWKINASGEILEEVIAETDLVRVIKKVEWKDGNFAVLSGEEKSEAIKVTILSKTGEVLQDYTLGVED